jgi:hypothetical protein
VPDGIFVLSEQAVALSDIEVKSGQWRQLVCSLIERQGRSIMAFAEADLRALEDPARRSLVRVHLAAEQRSDSDNG